MINTEWKKGYEEGFAAGWKAAQGNNFLPGPPPVYYGTRDAGTESTGAYTTGQSRSYTTGQFTVTPTESTGYAQATMADTGPNPFRGEFEPGTNPFVTMSNGPTDAPTFNNVKTFLSENH